MTHCGHCDFCDEFRGGRQNAFAFRYEGRLQHRILSSSENFVVMPSLGQIAEGHLLITPVKHYLALADVPQANRSELDVLLNKVQITLREAYGDCVCFEHGVRSPSGGCGISHAHMHLVPATNESGFFDRLKSQHDFVHVRSVTEVDKYLNGSPYLFVETADELRYAAAVGPIPSQYLRKQLADALGSVCWDWKRVGVEESLIAVTRQLSKSFAEATNECG